MADHQFLLPPPAHRPSAWDASDDNSAMLEILEKPPHSLSRWFSEGRALPRRIVLQKLDYRLISVLRLSLIQNTPPLWLVVIFGPSSLLLTTKNFDFHLRIWTTYGQKMPALDLVVTKLDCQVFLICHFSLNLFWKDLSFQRLGKREWRTNISRSKMRCSSRMMRR